MLFSQKLSDKYGRKKKIRMINSMKDLLGSIMSTTLYFFYSPATLWTVLKNMPFK